MTATGTVDRATAVEWGDKLRDLIRAWTATATPDQRSDTPNPEGWARLAADVFRFRTTLPVRHGRMWEMAQLLDRFATARLVIERGKGQQAVPLSLLRCAFDKRWSTEVMALLAVAEREDREAQRTAQCLP